MAATVGFVVIWILTNAFVAFGGLTRVVSGSSDDVSLSMRGGWSPWPGRVHADRVEVKAHDNNVEFSIVLEDARVSIALHDLASRVFHATRVRGESVAFLFRHKVEDLEDDELRVAAFPKIAGFEDPPLKRPRSEQGPGDPWTIRMENVDVPAKELWFMEYRFKGKARATGSFLLRPGKKLEVGPARLDIESGAVTVGAQSAIGALRGSIECRIEEHDPTKPVGLAVLHPMSGRIALEAEDANLAVSGIYRQRDDAAVSGIGRVVTDLRISRGRLERGSHASFETDNATWSNSSLSLVFPARIEADIVPSNASDGEERVRIRVASKTIRTTPGGSEEPARLENVSASVQTLGTSLAEPMQLSSASLDAALTMPDLSVLNGLLEKTMFIAGRVRGTVNLSMNSSATITGRAEIRTSEAELRLGDQAVGISGTVQAKDIAHDTRTHQGEVGTLQVQVDEVELGLPDEQVARWWFSLAGRKVAWAAEPKPSLSATFDLGAGDAEPLLPLLIDSGIIRSAAATLLSFEKTRGRFSIDHEASTLNIRVHELKSGDLETRGGLRNDLDGLCGAFLVRAGPANVGVLLTPSGTDVSPFVGNDWLVEHVGTDLKVREASRCAWKD